ncbi:MAG: glycine betaine/L-proline ABC transporter ATP-binding protein [Kiloniellales bacterium]
MSDRAINGGTATRIRARNVSKVFAATDEALALIAEGRDKAEIKEKTGSVVGVADVSFDVGAGETFVVMGLSGSGKSTLLRCLNRLITPTAGSVEIDGEDVVAADEKALRQLRLGKIAMVFQHFALLPHRTVVENVEYGLKVQGIEARERRRRAEQVLELVGLESWSNSRTSELSGGMQQRVGLARALAVDPDILLMDEPFSALDPLIRRDMQDELLELQRRFRKTIVFITHDLHEALKLGDRVAIMKAGRFVQVGAPEEIVANPADDYVSAFTQDVDSGRILRLRTVMRAPVSMPMAEADLAAVKRRLEGSKAVYLIDKAGRPVGLVDRRRLAQQAEAASLQQIMRKDFPQAGAESPIVEIYKLCSQGLPIAVVDDEGRLQGAVDPLQVFAELAPQSKQGPKQRPGQPAAVAAK